MYWSKFFLYDILPDRTFYRRRVLTCFQTSVGEDHIADNLPRAWHLPPDLQVSHLLFDNTEAQNNWQGSPPNKIWYYKMHANFSQRYIAIGAKALVRTQIERYFCIYTYFSHTTTLRWRVSLNTNNNDQKKYWSLTAYSGSKCVSLMWRIP